MYYDATKEFYSRGADEQPALSQSISPGTRKALAFLQQNFDQPVSLDDLARIASLSLFRFATVFRREVGMPPHRYLCHLRVNAAKTLLRQGVPGALAAAEAGFFDQSHMYRHFKRVCGVTPGQYQAAALGTLA
jgi:AraC-like DNA-binding protein